MIEDRSHGTDAATSFPRPCRRGRAVATLALSAALLVALHASALAQGRQTGTVRGSVVDAQGLVLPGVTVTVRSAALQGLRTTVTDINGNYQILALPPGAYDVVFELSGFADINEMATVSLGGDVGVNAAMAPAGVVETVQVVGVVPTPIETTVASSNITADEVNALPTSRTPWRIAELQPGLTDNTPNGGQLTINGAFAYDNIFLVDGVDINDNLFGTANALYVSDAIQETQVLTSGISAEYGRFSGGVINVITRSGGNDFSGSYRLNMDKPSWTSVTPFERESGTDEREGDLGDNLAHEITFGGPLVRDRLWYFYSGWFTAQEETDTFADTGIGFNSTSDEKRNQIKLTATLAPGHTLSGSYLNRSQASMDPSFSWSITPSTISTGRRPQDLLVTTYRGSLTNAVFAEVQYSQKRHGFRDSGGTSTDIFDSPMLTRRLTRAQYNAPYFDATDPEDRNNRQITGSVTWFASTPTIGSHSLKAGFERFTTTRTGGNSQSSTGYDIRTDYAVGPDGSPLIDADQQLTPVFTPGVSWLVSWVATRGARIDIHTTSFFVNDEWALDEHFSFNLGVRGEVIDSEATGGITTVDTSSVVPRLAMAYDPLGDGRFTIQSHLQPLRRQVQRVAVRRDHERWQSRRACRLLCGAARTRPQLRPGLRPGQLHHLLWRFRDTERLLRSGSQVAAHEGVHGVGRRRAGRPRPREGHVRPAPVGQLHRGLPRHHNRHDGGHVRGRELRHVRQPGVPQHGPAGAQLRRAAVRRQLQCDEPLPARRQLHGADPQRGQLRG